MALRQVLLSTSAFVCLLILLNSILLKWTASLMLGASFRLPETARTLVLGHSQVECAINDSALTHSVNMAQSGEAYLYAYLKAKEFLARNPSVDTLWLSYNFSALDQEWDTLTRSDGYIEHKLPLNFFLCGPEGSAYFLEQDQHVRGTRMYSSLALGSDHESLERTNDLPRSGVRWCPQLAWG